MKCRKKTNAKMEEEEEERWTWFIVSFLCLHYDIMDASRSISLTISTELHAEWLWVLFLNPKRKVQQKKKKIREEIVVTANNDLIPFCKWIQAKGKRNFSLIFNVNLLPKKSRCVIGLDVVSWDTIFRSILSYAYENEWKEQKKTIISNSSNMFIWIQ